MKLGKGGKMTDLDFDEIDKAVASAMSSDSPEPETPEDTSLPMVVEEDLPAPVEKPLPPAVRRTTGRIMDVVGPNRSVKRDTKVVTPASEAKPKQADELVEAAPTPFLPDANEKVEKRPLGYSEPTTPGVHASELHAEPVNPRKQETVPELGSADQPVGADTPVPAELSEDLLSLDGSVDTFETPFVAGTSPDAEGPKDENEQKPEAEAASEPISEPSQPVPDIAPSIVQQYQEKQSSANEPTGAIYDTEAYHTPIKEPVKKKNILWIVLWILGLIIVGAGIGWAVYAFVLPLL